MMTYLSVKILFLDDSPDRREIFREHNPVCDMVETASEAIAALERNVYDTASLDHNLGDPKKANELPETGMEVVRWIQEHRPTIRQVVVHRSDAWAAERMVQALRRAGYHSFRRPFGFRGWKIEGRAGN